jgi:molybdopterin/thiamine biosynthesis adenylyltransferase
MPRSFCSGAGGLGSPAALYLAAAGVGHARHHRHGRGAIRRISSVRFCTTWTAFGERKVDSAKKTLTAMNPDINVVTYDTRLGADNVLSIIDGYDVIVDGTDNFPTRYLVNDARRY